MASTLWLVTGTLVYLIVATGIFLKLQPGRGQLAAFVVAAVVLYVPFVGFPFFTAGSRMEEGQRDNATLQIELLKQQQAMLDKTTGAPKEDRYLDAGELRRLIDALARKLPADAQPPPAGMVPPICDYLYLYGWFLARPELTLTEKWNAALYMPRLFYKPDTGPTDNGAPDYDAMAREVKLAWTALRRAWAAAPGLGFCPDPP